VTTITAPDDKAFKLEKDGVVIEYDPSRGDEVAHGTHGPGGKPSSSAEITPRTKAILNALEKPIAMSFPDETPLEDVLKYIKEATKNSERDSGIPIYVDPVGLQDAEKALNSTIKIDIDGKPLSTTLPLVLGQLGLDHCAKDDLLFISSPDGVAAEQKRHAVAPLDDTADTKVVMDALEKAISMAFPIETPLEDVLKYIKQATTNGERDSGISIYVDPLGLQEAEKSSTSTITIDLEGVPLKTTLRHLLRQLRLGYLVKKGVLHVTSIERVEKELKRL
jgi:hypothetical protein